MSDFWSEVEIPLQLTDECNMESSIGNSTGAHEPTGQTCIDEPRCVLRIRTHARLCLVSVAYHLHGWNYEPSHEVRKADA